VVQRYPRTLFVESGSPNSVRLRLLRSAIGVGSWLSFALILAAWPVLYLGDLYWPATLLMFSPRWLPIVPLVGLLLAAACWRRRSLVILLPALLLLLGPVMNFTWHVVPPAAPAGTRLRVLTCNLHHRYPDIEAWRRMLADLDPDVLAVQELPSDEPDLPFADEAWHLNRARGLFLASRFPIVDSVRLGSDSMKQMGSVMCYTLQTPAGEITLFSLHFASPRDGLYEVLHHPSTGIAALEDNTAVRRQQFARLARLADEATGPVLLMGDFNTPPESLLFRQTWSRYTDAFSAAGWGWGYTFLGAKTTVRIDHILAGSDWHCERCWIGPNLGSPHRPVVADLICTTASAERR
jgi:vancomycin resistance protein VanJ